MSADAGHGGGHGHADPYLKIKVGAAGLLLVVLVGLVLTLLAGFYHDGAESLRSSTRATEATWYIFDGWMFRFGRILMWGAAGAFIGIGFMILMKKVKGGGGGHGDGGHH